MHPLPTIPDSYRARLRLFGIASGILMAAFGATLADLFHYCVHNDLFSYILLVPVVSGIMIAQRLGELDFGYKPATTITAGLGTAALILLAWSFIPGSPEDEILALRVLAFVLSWNAVAAGILGGGFMCGLVFPAAFLVFMTPLPDQVVGMIEAGLQHASAEVAGWLFPMAGIPNFRVDLAFQLPNITLQVAPECSGIRSTLVLFITSLVAGQLLLNHAWQRTILSLLVIPLGILRNAARIVTLGWLCTHHGQEMIDSPIHHRGGPVFFVLSLLPLFAMLLVFRRFGRRKPLG